MKNYDIQFELTYAGADAESHEIDLYDVSQALMGFQRSLAITTHLVLNGKIITQAPALKGARIFAFPSEEGSWKTKAGILILGTAGYHVATAPNNTPLGHLVYSAYDYVISESLGFHVDYNKSLGQLYEEYSEQDVELPEIRESQLDSVIEKCTTAITEIHRPIFKTATAEHARITTTINGEDTPLSPTFSIETFHYITEEYPEEEVTEIRGFVSSYNSNTYKGRVYVPEEGRPVAFELAEFARVMAGIELVVESLASNALRGYDVDPVEVFFKVRRVTTKSGHLKKYIVLATSDEMFLD